MTKFNSHNAKIGQLLVKAGVITSDHLEQGLQEQKSHPGEPLCTTLGWLGIAPEEKLLPVLAQQLGISYLSLKLCKVDPELVKQIPARLANRYRVLPVSREGGVLVVAMVDPLDTKVLDELQMLTHMPVRAAIVSTQELSEAIRQFYGMGAEVVETMVGGGYL